MIDSDVSVFFYGSFMNRRVLAEVDLEPAGVETARLWGFDIFIAPLATLVPSDRRCVFGIVCRAEQAALDRLYGREWVAAYRPRAVVVEIDGGRMIPALCYVAPPAAPFPAAPEYIDRIVAPAKERGFPEWYIRRIESFRDAPLAG